MTSPDPLQAHLRALEESLLRPDVRKSAQLADMLAEDFVEFGTSGRVYSKADILAFLQAETPGELSMSNFRMTLLAPDTALLTFQGRREGAPVLHTLRSSIWQKRDERWQLVFHQSTPTTEPR
jgi:hypothetical protein